MRFNLQTQNANLRIFELQLVMLGVNLYRAEITGDRLSSAGCLQFDLDKPAAVPEGLPGLLRLGRNVIELLRGMNRDLVRVLETESVLAGRVTRLMSIPGVGVILALTWVLEIGDVGRSATQRSVVSFGY